MFAIRHRSTLLGDTCIAMYATIAKETMVQTPYWESAVSEAEKIVGFSATFLNHSWLRSKEITFLKHHLKEFTYDYPVLKNTKNLIYNEKNKMQPYWSLIVLLISKAAGHLNVDDLEKDATGILRSQISLSEVTEMLRLSYLFHKNLVNLQKSDSPEAELDEMNFGNKIALLGGDYFLAKSFEVLANIRNHDVSELLSSCIRDLAEAEFIGRRDNQNNPLPSEIPADRTDYAVKEWTLRHELTVGSILGKSCEGTLKLAKHNKEMQEEGCKFGKHLALAWEATRDLHEFISKDRISPINLCSAPIIFHIESDPSILIEIDKGLESVSNVDYAKVHDIVVHGPGIELTKQLQQEHLQRAMDALSVFQGKEAKTALSNIVAAMVKCLK